MPKAIRNYVRYVDAVNRMVGQVTMCLIFVMMGILLYAAISRTFFNLPLIWAVEMAQMTMTTYYILGGAYSLQLGAHVRMDLLYDNWTEKRKAFTDSITAFCLVFYLIILMYGGISSTQYALEYDQRNFSVWAPPMAPVKIIMCIGIFMMLLQALSLFFRDLAKVKGVDIDETRGQGA